MAGRKAIIPEIGGADLRLYRHRRQASERVYVCSFSAARSIMPPKYKFTDGEKVLCFHGPLLYEAKVQKAQMKDKAPQFWIHYGGWSRTWDEWVPESRILKWNDSNLQRQRELQTLHPDKKRPSNRKRERGKKDQEPVISSRRKRPRQDTPLEMASDQEVRVEISDELKKWLVDDWDFITRQKQLVRLPKKVTVADILRLYHEHACAGDTDKAKSGQLDEVCAGLREYFNVLLGSQLLYKFERPQYAEILVAHPDKPMSDLYGIEHLLRMFVRLGPILSRMPMDEESVSLLHGHFQDFLKYLESSHSLFTMEYDAAPQEYHRRIA